jgi:hypothetical protein
MEEMKFWTFLLYAKTRRDASNIDQNERRAIEREAIEFFLSNEELLENGEPKKIKCKHVWGRATDYGGWVAIVETADAESLWDLVTGDMAKLFDIQVEPLVDPSRSPEPVEGVSVERNIRRLIPESLGNSHW